MTGTKNNNSAVSQRLSFNRRAVRASATVNRKKNTIHCLTEAEISVLLNKMNTWHQQTGQKISLTACVVFCLAHTLKEFPEFNSFIRFNRLVLLKDVTISVLVERELENEKVPEPLAICHAHQKSLMDIQHEIREAQHVKGDKLGQISDNYWFYLIPSFLLKLFIRLADKSIKMAERYGKAAVTAIGMFGQDNMWFIPHGSATVLVTVGSISRKPMIINDLLLEKEYLNLTFSFNHDIVDGAPAARFVKYFCDFLAKGMVKFD